MRSKGWQFALAFGALSFIPFGLTAQEKKDKPQGPPADGPGPVHKKLVGLAGSWDVAVTYVIDGGERTGTARCESHWILGGRFLQQEYNSNFMGKPFTVLQLLGYDNQKKKTIELMMDTLSTSVLHNEGSISEDGKVITNEGELLNHETGKPLKLRTVTTIIDQYHYTLEWFQPGASGKDEKVVSMSHSRRKP
jgi:Protein of unknown function (DUF1579)